MAKLFPAFALSALLLAPLSAHADWMIEGSAGTGLTLSPHSGDRIPTNIMVAPGYKLSFVRLQLGVVGNLSDVKHSKFDLDLRPMVMVKPPLFPLYGRAILGVSGLVEGPSSLNYGGAVGARLGALGVGGFLEAGILSKRIKVNDKDKDAWYAEGRIGVYFE